MTKGSTITIYKYLMGVNSSEEEELFSVVKGLSWLRAIRLNWTKQNINWIAFVMLAGCKGSSQGTWWKQWCLGQLKRHREQSSIYVMDLGTLSHKLACQLSLLCPCPHRPVSTWAHTQINKEGRRGRGGSASAFSWFVPFFWCSMLS